MGATAAAATKTTTSSKEDSLKRLTVVVLKEMLQERGLKVSGRKAELIERLIAANEHTPTKDHDSKTSLVTRPEPALNGKCYQDSSRIPTAFDELKRRTVVELKFMLRKLGRKVSGRKVELVERLVETNNLRCARNQSPVSGEEARLNSDVRTTYGSSGTHAKSFTAFHGRNSLQRRTVLELKGMLRERGLKVSGRKAELIERLIGDY
eukprot:jgi/Psemu1/305679/fgenesh1_kg.211_\